MMSHIVIPSNLLLWSGIVCLLLSVVHAYEAESRLVAHLLKGYNPMVRPRLNPAETIDVKFGLAVNQILDMSEPEQVLKTGVWLRVYWRDDLLHWNSTEWNGVTAVTIKMADIWHPDIVLYNDVNDGGRDLYSMFPATAYSDGSMVWLAPNVQFSSCALSVTYFPWDVQICPMKFGSWAYHGHQLDLVNRTVAGDLSSIEVNAEWDIPAMPVYRRVYKYNCCPEPYPVLTFYLVLKRKPMYYINNLVMPATFLMFTSMLVFFLPSDSGEKITLSLTMLLASTVFLLIVSEILPPQSDDVPLIGMYFLVQIGVLALSSVFTVFVLRIHYRGNVGDRCPQWLRVLVLKWMARFLCMENFVTTLLCDLEHKEQHEEFIKGKPDPNEITLINLSKDQLLLQGIINELRLMSSIKKRQNINNEKVELITKEWTLVAMVIDWFLFLVFLAVTVITSFVVLYNRPDVRGETYHKYLEELPPGQW